MNTFKEECITLRKKDFSLNEIAKILCRSKTSVYFHVKDIHLSSERFERYRKESTNRIVAYSLNRKGKSFLGYSPRGFKSWTRGYVTLVSHFIFDGEIKKYSCIYHNRNSALIDEVKKCIKNVYPFEPKQYEQLGVKRIDYNNIELAQYILKKSQDLLQNILNMSQEHQRSFLRSFFNDEGCVYFNLRKRVRQVKGYQHDNKILELIKRLLRNFGIASRIDRKFYEIVIGRRENLLKFAEEINFSPGVRINGERSNSIWRKSLEKREILQRALESYVS